MRALLFPGDRVAVLGEVPTVQPAPGEVRVRVAASGVCGSDLHRYRLDRSTRAPARDVVTGHEAIGVVDAVGDGVPPSLIGQRVAMFHILNCATFGRDCGNGCADNPKRCTDLSIMGVTVNGGNAPWQTVAASKLLPVPAWMTDTDAVATVCNFGTAWSGVRAIEVGPEPVAVWGLGPVGLSAVLMAVKRGARVIGLDPSPERRGIAAALGAHVTADPSALDQLLDVCRLLGDRPSAQLDASGSPAAHRAMVEIAPHGGRIGLLGMGAVELAVPLRQVMLRELTIRGVFLFDQGDWDSICADCQTHGIRPGEIVTVQCHWSQAPEFVARADAGALGKVAIDWTDAGVEA